jgi:hypothetical protein
MPRGRAMIQGLDRRIEMLSDEIGRRRALGVIEG